MRYKAILADLARKRYPLSILLIVIGVLVIPFTYLFVHYDVCSWQYRRGVHS